MLELMNKKISKIFSKISAFMDTPYFAMVYAALELLCYYLELDIVIIIAISLALTFAALVKKNLNCLLVLFLFMSSMISWANSPANYHDYNNHTYYFQPTIFIPIIVAVAIPVIIIIIRAIYNIIKKRVKMNAIFITTVVLGVTFLINGLFRGDYNPLDTVFGLFMFFFYVLLFFGLLPDVSLNKSNILNICRQVAIYAIVPVVETIVIYTQGIINGQAINEISSFYGWGNENTIGMILVVCMCFVLYSSRFETKIIFKGLSHLLMLLMVASVIVTISRQAYLFTAFVLFLYTFILIFKSKGKTRIKYIVYLSVSSVVTVTVLLLCYFNGLLEKAGLNLDSGGRFDLWNIAWNSFIDHPVLGGGFYYMDGDPVIGLSSVMPLCCHNTVLELFAACGAIGGVAYLTYRVFTVIGIAKSMSKEKVYPVMALTAMVLMSLIDIHILDLLGSALYIVLLAMALSKKQVEETVEEK